MIGQQLGLGTGRHVKHVETVFVSNSQIDRPASGNDRRLVVADSRMVGYPSSTSPSPSRSAANTESGLLVATLMVCSVKL